MNDFVCPCCAKAIEDGFHGAVYKGKVYHPKCLMDSFIVMPDDSQHKKRTKEHALVLIGYGISKGLLQELHRRNDSGTINDIYNAVMLTDHNWLAVYVTEDGTEYFACSFHDKKVLENDILQADSEDYILHALYYKGSLHDAKIIQKVSITKSKR